MDISEYFGKVWTHDTEYKWTGNYLIDEINSLKPNRVLDVGCGFNYYKGKINNLIGIDPYNDKADMKVSIEEFGNNIKYDVIMALGSINFGDDKIIEHQMRCIDKLLDTDGQLFMRLNPGLDHHWAEGKSSEINFYPWSKEKISNFALAYGYSIVAWEEDPNMHGALRYYAHLVKM